jgi:hypothetical protein
VDAVCSWVAVCGVKHTQSCYQINSVQASRRYDACKACSATIVAELNHTGPIDDVLMVQALIRNAELLQNTNFAEPTVQHLVLNGLTNVRVESLQATLASQRWLLSSAQKIPLRCRMRVVKCIHVR